jgi:hypothetical protein
VGDTQSFWPLAPDGTGSGLLLRLRRYERRPDKAEVPGSIPGRSTHDHRGAVDELVESPGFHPGHVAGSSPVRATARPARFVQAGHALVAQKDRAAENVEAVSRRESCGCTGTGPVVSKTTDREPQPPAGKRVASPSTRGRGFESHPGHDSTYIPASPNRQGSAPLMRTREGSNPSAGAIPPARIAQRKSAACTRRMPQVRPLVRALWL